MRILKKIFWYVGAALTVGLGLLFIFESVMRFVRGESATGNRFLSRPILFLCVLAVVTAYVKLRQKYKARRSNPITDEADNTGGS
jgi:hypothetical protein